MRIRALLAVFAVALLAACTQSPTAPATPGVDTEAAAFGGTGTIGSGL